MAHVDCQRSRASPHVPLEVRHTVTVDQAILLTGLSRTRLFQLIRKKEIQSMKVGRRRMIVAASLLEHLDITANLERIAEIALANGRRLLKHLLPEGELRDRRFVVAGEGQHDNVALILTLFLDTGVWVDARDPYDAPVRGKGIVALVAHLKGISITQAAALVARLLNIDLSNKE